MERGYIKLFRKVQDSVSWSRGLEYRGLMVSIMVRVSRRKTAYQGVEIQAGQFAVKVSEWARELKQDRKRLKRMLDNLCADNFIKTKNSGNRFTLISVVNWGVYQASENANRATTGQPPGNQCPTTGQPPGNHRATTGQPIEQEIENKDKENPVVPFGSECEFEELERGGFSPAFDSPGMERRADDTNPKAQDGYRQREGHPPGIVQPDYNMPFEEFWAAWVETTGKNSGKEAAWQAWKVREQFRNLPGLSELQGALLEQSRSEQWQKEDGRFIPAAKNWLKEARWADKLPAAAGSTDPIDFLEQAKKFREKGRAQA